MKRIRKRISTKELRTNKVKGCNNKNNKKTLEKTEFIGKNTYKDVRAGILEITKD